MTYDHFISPVRKSSKVYLTRKNKWVKNHNS